MKSADAQVALLAQLENAFGHGGEMSPYALNALLSDAFRELNLLRDALIQVDRTVSMCRIWGGMEWKYHAMIPQRVEKIAKVAREALGWSQARR